MIGWAGWCCSRETRKPDADETRPTPTYRIPQPRTPAYALHDSPIGLLAWLTEKFESFIQLAAQRPPSVDAPKPTLTREILYETATLYWLTNSIGTSFSPYSMNQHYSDFLKDPRYHLPNFGLSIFPWEIAIVPKKWVESTGNLKWYKGETRLLGLAPGGAS